MGMAPIDKRIIAAYIATIIEKSSARRIARLLLRKRPIRVIPFGSDRYINFYYITYVSVCQASCVKDARIREQVSFS